MDRCYGRKKEVPGDLMPETPEVGDAVEQTEHELERLSSADLVVGIPTYNNSETIASVITAARAGLDRYFPESHTVIVHADGGSKDGTIKAALEAAEPQ